MKMTPRVKRSSEIPQYTLHLYICFLFALGEIGELQIPSDSFRKQASLVYRYGVCFVSQFGGMKYLSFNCLEMIAPPQKKKDDSQ